MKTPQQTLAGQLGRQLFTRTPNRPDCGAECAVAFSVLPKSKYPAPNGHTVHDAAGYLCRCGQWHAFHYINFGGVL